MNSTNEVTHTEIPIREISRITGVNSVTLRAWERRYGLIKPLRTNKGHRLYKHEDIELIKNIQTWLARGLAISKVSKLLESGQQIYEENIEDIWLGYFGELITILTQLNVGKLDKFFNKLLSVYPAHLISDKLISPVIDNLSSNNFGNNIKKSIFENRLCEYVFMLCQRQRQQVTHKRIAIIQLNASMAPLLNALLHYSLLMSQIKSELIGLITVTEVVFAVEQFNLDGLIIYNNHCSSLVDYKKELIQLSKKITVPIFLGGNLAPVMEGDFLAHIHIANGAGQTAINTLLSNFFFDTTSDFRCSEGAM